MLDLQDARSPKPITWAQQRLLLPHLSNHSAQMALFVLNTGDRDAPVCSLRWEWEVRSPELRYSTFVVPKDAVIDAKGKVRGGREGTQPGSGVGPEPCRAVDRRGTPWQARD